MLFVDDYVPGEIVFLSGQELIGGDGLENRVSFFELKPKNVINKPKWLCAGLYRQNCVFQGSSILLSVKQVPLFAAR